ncbi:MAG: CPBP family glutamic-type intramembrane protease [Phycisphaerales bacterium]
MARRGPTTSRTSPNERPLPEVEDYWRLSSRPLHMLVLITPLVVTYEVGSYLYLTNEQTHQTTTIRARNILEVFFAKFGIAAVVASGAALAAVLVVLFIMHLLSRQPWRIRWMVVAGMLLEAGLWSLPLVVFGAVFKRAAAMITQMPAALVAIDGTDTALKEMPALAKATIAIGAGIYEELLFRLIGIAAVHFVVRDLLQASRTTAKVMAIAATAVAFAAYHPVSMPQGGLNWGLFVFYALAGVYFGCIYVGRGLGIVVATHAIYDLIALDVLR